MFDAVVENGKVVTASMNRIVATHDPTWHAGVEVIRLACVTLHNFKRIG